MESLVVQAARIDYGRIYLETILEEEEPLTPPALDKKQVTTTMVRTLILRCIWTFTYILHQQYVSIFLHSLRRKLFSAKGTAPVQPTATTN